MGVRRTWWPRGQKAALGDEIDTEKAEFNPSEGLKPVGSYPPNAYGSSTWPGRPPSGRRLVRPGFLRRSPAENPTGTERSKYRLVRGGGRHSGPNCTRVYRRLGSSPTGWISTWAPPPPMRPIYRRSAVIGAPRKGHCERVMVPGRNVPPSDGHDPDRGHAASGGGRPQPRCPLGERRFRWTRSVCCSHVILTAAADTTGGCHPPRGSRGVYRSTATVEHTTRAISAATIRCPN